MNWSEARIAAQRVCLGWSQELQNASRWEALLREAAPSRTVGVVDSNREDTISPNMLADVVEQLRAADSYLRALEVVANGGTPEAGGREWARAVDVMADAWSAIPVGLAIAVTREAERHGWIPKGTADNQERGQERREAARKARQA